MKKTILFILLGILVNGAFAQKGLQKKIDAVVTEGKLLYRSEMASWNGTDLLMEHFEEKQLVGGYFSYPLPNSQKTKCLFFSREENPEVIFEIDFDEDFSKETAVIVEERRPFNELEKDYYILRSIAAKEIASDPFYKNSYRNAKLNIIPIVGKKKKVYLLTGPSVTGVVIFGNDYLLEFNKKNKLKNRKTLHANLIPIDYGAVKDGEVVTTIHSHSSHTGELFTPTDVCTLMLYSKYAGWETHYVTSDKYTCIWSSENENFICLKSKVLEEIRELEKSNK